MATYRHPRFALLLLLLMGGCSPLFVSTRPLITPDIAYYPFAGPVRMVDVQELNEHWTWNQPIAFKAILVRDGNVYTPFIYGGISGGNEFFRNILIYKIDKSNYIVQGEIVNNRSHKSDWVYALIVHADRFYFYPFAEAIEPNVTRPYCEKLSAGEKRRFSVTVEHNQCYVSTLNGLVHLLLGFRDKFPYPAGSFLIRPLSGWPDAAAGPPPRHRTDRLASGHR